MLENKFNPISTNINTFNLKGFIFPEENNYKFSFTDYNNIDIEAAVHYIDLTITNDFPNIVATKLLPEKFSKPELGQTTSLDYIDITDHKNIQPKHIACKLYTITKQFAYGYLELERAQQNPSKSILNKISNKQHFQAEKLAIDINKYFLFGNPREHIYGILNSPELNKPITPLAVKVNSSSKSLYSWEEKAYNSKDAALHILQDVHALLKEIQNKTNNLINGFDFNFTLVLPTDFAQYLLIPDTNQLYVKDLIKTIIPEVNIICLDELISEKQNRIMLICNGQKSSSLYEIDNISAGYCVFIEKMRAHQVIQDTNCYKMAFSSTIAGAIITNPNLIATMIGI